MTKTIVTFTCTAILVIAMSATGIENEPPIYVGSSSCKDCHTHEYNSWKSSKHAKNIKSDQEMSPVCKGCHTTGMITPEQAPIEYDVGCEACHGPGGDHNLDGGDVATIVSSNSADICGRCHSGSQSGNNISWMKEYRPGMKLSDIPELKLVPVDPKKTPPPANAAFPSLTYNMWLASGHSKKPDRKIKVGNIDWTEPISCVVCHNPHHSDNPSQLYVKPEKLCNECHFQDAVLKGKGAKGIEDTRSLHTPIPCISCHMTEGNHLMKVLRPDNPDLAENRTDSCSDCHEVKDRKIRAHQIKDWEAWYREAMDPIQEDLKTVEIALNKNPDLLNEELKTKLEDINANLSIIIKDGSNGVHNLDYALEIMALAKRHLREIKKAIQ